MRAVASALAALAFGTVLSGQVFAQSYGPESDDDAADSRPTYSDRYAPGSDSRSAYRDRQDDYDDQSVRRGPVRRYYRDSETGAWRPLSRRSGYDEPSYREERPAVRGSANGGRFLPAAPARAMTAPRIVTMSRSAMIGSTNRDRRTGDTPSRVSVTGSAIARRSPHPNGLGGRLTGGPRGMTAASSRCPT